jgi:peptidoglycan/xylan/chitin deacetylase (PgdA/CDA1 family)
MSIKKVRHYVSREFAAMNKPLFAIAFFSLILLLTGCQTVPRPADQLPTAQKPFPASPPATPDQENDSSMAEAPSYLDSTRWWDQGRQDPVRELVVETPEQLVARVPKRSNPKIVILQYHNVVFGRTGGEYNRDLYNFEHDLVFLRNRTQIIGIDDLPYLKSGEKKLTTDASILTFDDGDLSIYGVVFPLLKKYDIKATFFIITDFVGTVGYVNWEQLKEMSDYRNAGGEQLFSIGSHSLDHRRFDEIPAAQIPHELAESKFIIENNIGTPVWYFALPFGAGAGRKEIIDAAKNSGYRGIRTSRKGVMQPGSIDPYDLPVFYMSNERADILAQQIYSLLGR